MALTGAWVEQVVMMLDLFADFFDHKRVVTVDDIGG